MKGIAIVTGGSRGIGEAIVRRLNADGYQVWVFDMTKPEHLIQSEIAAGYREVDVTRPDSVMHAVTQVLEDQGPIDVLCNNAGVSTMKSVVDLTEEEWDFNFNVNIKGTFLMTKAVLPGMIERHSGTIVNTASMAGLKGVPLLSHYAASKWAVIGFTKSVALEVAKYGIRINAVCPGYVRTSMQERELSWEGHLRSMSPTEVFQEYVRLTPLGRIEEPDDVARVVGFLVSADSEFITGGAVSVTEGASL